MGSRRAATPSALREARGHVGQALPRPQARRCATGWWRGRGRPAGTRSAHPGARASPALDQVSSRTPQPVSSLARPASVYSSVSRSGDTHSPWSSRSSPGVDDDGQLECPARRARLARGRRERQAVAQLGAAVAPGEDGDPAVPHGRPALSSGRSRTGAGTGTRCALAPEPGQPLARAPRPRSYRRRARSMSPRAASPRGGARPCRAWPRSRSRPRPANDARGSRSRLVGPAPAHEGVDEDRAVVLELVPDDRLERAAVGIDGREGGEPARSFQELPDRRHASSGMRSSMGACRRHGGSAAACR